MNTELQPQTTRQAASLFNSLPIHFMHFDSNVCLPMTGTQAHAPAFLSPGQLHHQEPINLNVQINSTLMSQLVLPGSCSFLPALRLKVPFVLLMNDYAKQGYMFGLPLMCF